VEGSPPPSLSSMRPMRRTLSGRSRRSSDWRKQCKKGCREKKHRRVPRSTELVRGTLRSQQNADHGIMESKACCFIAPSAPCTGVRTHGRQERASSPRHLSDPLEQFISRCSAMHRRHPGPPSRAALAPATVPRPPQPLDAPPSAHDDDDDEPAAPAAGVADATPPAGAALVAAAMRS